MNEDVFAARSREMSGMDDEIRALQGQIYKLLLQVKRENRAHVRQRLILGCRCGCKWSSPAWMKEEQCFFLSTSHSQPNPD